MHDAVKRPSHYTSGKIEVWDAITAWGLDYCRGNVVKYMARAGKKGDRDTELEDLRKAKAYVEKAIDILIDRTIDEVIDDTYGDPIRLTPPDDDSGEWRTRTLPL